MKQAVAAAAVFVTGAGLFGAAVVLGAREAEALAPCEVHQNTGEELEFLNLLQSWRDRNIPGSHGLSVSASLNAAAAGYARFVADTPNASGHYADGGAEGRAWSDRAIQCGYPPGLAGGGEGIAVLESASPVSLGAQEALAIMEAHRGSGIWVPSNIGVDVRCVGMAKAASSDGRKVVWVTLVFAGGTPCPSEVDSTPTDPATQTVTSTPTRTPSPTPTAPPSDSYTVALPLLGCDSCGGD
ncbi:MAG: hypothetical protein M0R74_06665 [Dehalococcoidia bacterium]|nr:hypothetical protein [Dehalococcoidia bacterium]